MKRPPQLRALLGAVAAGALVLLLPPRTPEVELPGESTAFRWDAAALFAGLEAEFDRATAAAPDQIEVEVGRLTAEGDALLGSVARSLRTPHGALEHLAGIQFALAVRGAARPALLTEVRDFLARGRVTVTRAAATWEVDRPTHEGLYRVLLGGRIALEEALAQTGGDALPALHVIEDVPSATPSLLVEGVRIHSGDMLLSRGGAPTSALIARGNDFPNAFSHVALAHVDAQTGEGTVIESLIEAGSVLHTVEEYLESQRHRIIAVRLRPDHPALVDDPLLPHRAAESALQEVRARHIPYDFAMNWEDFSEAFCSEIVYHAYRAVGVELWAHRSSMSAPGLVSWLAAMGVREFTSLVPSDLEYDPNVRAVLEWRDVPAMMDYRLDNAVIDALLEEAERGARLDYAWYALPAGRTLKALSVGQDLLGFAPLIPEGMSAATALRIRSLVEVVHPAVKGAVELRARHFRSETGHEAPYWTLVEMARRALAEQRQSLEPALSPG